MARWFYNWNVIFPSYESERHCVLCVSKAQVSCIVYHALCIIYHISCIVYHIVYHIMCHIILIRSLLFPPYTFANTY